MLNSGIYSPFSYNFVYHHDVSITLEGVEYPFSDLILAVARAARLPATGLIQAFGNEIDKLCLPFPPRTTNHQYIHAAS
jgi:hypothetical protein